MQRFALSDSTTSPLVKSALSLALAAACLWAADADAREGRHGQSGGRPIAGSPGHGQWHGRQVGGHGHRWQGHGHRWRGHGHRHFHPGWAIGLGVGAGLTYPWWGYPYGYWGYPNGYAVYDRPVGIVLEEEPGRGYGGSAYRWYCPSPAGYHPDVRECSQGWLRVLPGDAPPGSPPLQ